MPRKGLLLGFLKRVTGSERADYFYSVYIGEGTERGLEEMMENDLKQNPKYNWMTDFAYATASYKKVPYVVIIKVQQQNFHNSRNTLMAGFGENEQEALQDAENNVKKRLYLNKLERMPEIVFTKDYSDELYPTRKNPLYSYFVNTEWEIQGYLWGLLPNGVASFKINNHVYEDDTWELEGNKLIIKSEGPNRSIYKTFVIDETDKEFYSGINCINGERDGAEKITMKKVKR